MSDAVAASETNADAMKLKIREVLEELLPQAELEHVVRHELEEFIWRTILRKFDQTLREMTATLTSEMFTKKLDALLEKKLGTNIDAYVETQAKLLLRDIRAYADELKEDSTRKFKNFVENELEKTAAKAVKEIAEQNTAKIKEKVETAIERATKDYFVELVAERMKILISTLERLEKKADALEQRLRSAERQTAGTW